MTKLQIIQITGQHTLCIELAAYNKGVKQKNKTKKKALLPLTVTKGSACQANQIAA